MIRINLLPHRAERRKRQRQQFLGLIGLAAVAGIVGWGLGHLVIAERISHQQSRNEFLKAENTRLDKQIQEIKKLKEDIAALLARKQVIETLQANRAQSVQLLDELAKHTPDGVYLRSIKQDGLKVKLTGYAQSNARVSTLMRNIQGSEFLTNPQLVEIKAATVNNRRISDFDLNFFMKPAQEEKPKAPAGVRKPPAPGAGTSANAAAATKG